MKRFGIVGVLAFLVLGLGAGPLFGQVAGFKVTTDKTVDPTSLQAIVKDVLRLSGAKSNDEKAIAIHEYLHHTIFHFAYPREKRPQSIGPLKVINVYGWGLCGGQHTVLKSLFETAGWKVRYRGWHGHTTIEVNYDNKWHYFDTFLKCYFWTKDKKTIAGQDDIVKDPSIVLDGKKDGRVPPNDYLCCGDTEAGIVSGVRTSKPYPVAKPSNGWASVTGRDRGYSPLLALPSGASLRLDWNFKPGMVVVKGRNYHTCGTKDFRHDPVLGPVLQHYGRRTWANGRFVYAPDFSKSADVADIELSGAAAKDGKLAATGGKGVAVFKLPLPYAYAAAKVEALFEGGEGKLSLSPNAGKSWTAAAPGDLSALPKQHYGVWIKAEFKGALTKFRLEATVEHNRCALPYLVNGKNAVTVSTQGNKLPAGTVLRVTYAYQEATNPPSLKRWDRPAQYGELKKVTREITQLPFHFEINAGGNTPPKMISLERAVVAK